MRLLSRSTADCHIDENEKSKVFEEFREINYISEKEHDCVELSHVQDKTIREEVNALVNNYEPKNVNECPIEMDIILTDETPVATKPKQMSPSEKLELEKQVEQWLKGVVRNSFSDFSAQVISVPKKDGFVWIFDR